MAAKRNRRQLVGKILHETAVEDMFLSDDNEAPVRVGLTLRMRDSSLTGMQRAKRLAHGHPGQFFQQTRMPKTAFDKLEDILRTRCNITDGYRVKVREKLFLFLQMLDKGLAFRDQCYIWQRAAGTTVSYGEEVLIGILSLKDDYIKPPSTTVHPHILSKPHLQPWFDKCVGALDGTHISACINKKRQNRYRDYKGGVSPNVFAACDWDGYFTYIACGWEGSAHDGRLFRDARENGLDLPSGYFYLADGGFPCGDILLTPYKEVMYHQAEWRNRGNSYRFANMMEYYNRQHSSLRAVIECQFGILKNRFKILRQMIPFKTFKKQVQVVLAYFILHNFIKRHSVVDEPDWELSEEEDNDAIPEPVAPDNLDSDDDEDDA